MAHGDGGGRDDLDNEAPDKDPHYSEKGGHKKRGDFWRAFRRERGADFRSRSDNPHRGR